MASQSLLLLWSTLESMSSSEEVHNSVFPTFLSLCNAGVVLKLFTNGHFLAEACDTESMPPWQFLFLCWLLPWCGCIFRSSLLIFLTFLEYCQLFLDLARPYHIWKMDTNTFSAVPAQSPQSTYNFKNSIQFPTLRKKKENHLTQILDFTGRVSVIQ